MDLEKLTDEELHNKLVLAALDAIAVQEACNLSGVVLGWALVMQVINEIAHRKGYGTEWKNRHPINCLFANKVADLTGMSSGDLDRYREMYKACQQLAGQKG
jgi:hypothetical protein